MSLGREAEIRLRGRRGTQSQERMIKGCLCVNWHDSTVREGLIMQESGSSQGPSL